MFSGALLDVLGKGSARVLNFTINGTVGLGDQGRQIREHFPADAVKPEVQSPDQSVEDIALVPIFPNAAMQSQAHKGPGGGTRSPDAKLRNGQIEALAMRGARAETSMASLADIQARIKSIRG